MGWIVLTAQSEREHTRLRRFGGCETKLATHADLRFDMRKGAKEAEPMKRLLDKLGVKNGQTVALVGLRDQGFLDLLEERTAAVVHGRAEGCDHVFVLAETRADLDQLSDLKAWIKPGGAIWVVRAKGKKATIKESESMAAGQEAGLVDVKVVAFSDTHTAEKFVIPRDRR